MVTIHWVREAESWSVEEFQVLEHLRYVCKFRSHSRGKQFIDIRASSATLRNRTLNALKTSSIMGDCFRIAGSSVANPGTLATYSTMPGSSNFAHWCKITLPDPEARIKVFAQWAAVSAIYGAIIGG